MSTPDLTQAIEHLHHDCHSLLLALNSETGKPHLSYAPFVLADGCFYIFVSALAQHTAYLQAFEQRLNTTRQSTYPQILLIEDESKSRNIFARKRVNYEVDIKTIGREQARFHQIISLMHERLGNTVEVLVGLPDFVLFELKPIKGSLVLGFGHAYVFEPEKIADAVQLSDKNIQQYR